MAPASCGSQYQYNINIANWVWGALRGLLGRLGCSTLGIELVVTTESQARGIRRGVRSIRMLVKKPLQKTLVCIST